MLTDVLGRKKNILRLTEEKWENGRQGESGRKKLE